MSHPTNERSKTRRTFLRSSAAVGLTTMAAGCISGLSSSETEDGTDEITMVLNPAESNVNIKEQYRPLADYIESEVDVTVNLKRSGSYAATFQDIRSDRAHLADTSPSAAVSISDQADIVGMRVQYGAAQYFSLITTTPDSGIDELADIEDETVAMASQLSVSGTLVPLTMLQDAGLDVGSAPDGDPADFEVEFSDHTTAAEHLLNRPEINVASTGAFSTAANVPQEQFDELSDDFAEISAEYENAGTADEELQLLGVSDPLPRAPIMARSNWDDPIREDIEEVILNADEEDLSHDDDYDGEPLWFSNVVEGTEDDYAPIQQVFDDLGLEFEDLS